MASLIQPVGVHCYGIIDTDQWVVFVMATLIQVGDHSFNEGVACLIWLELD